MKRPEEQHETRSNRCVSWIKLAQELTISAIKIGDRQCAGALKHAVVQLDYLALGGVNNLGEMLRFVSDRLMLTGHVYAEPVTMPEHGIYLPDMDVATFEDWQRQRDPEKPTVAVLFYRAHRLSGNTGFIDTLAHALQNKGVDALCVFTSSLKSKDDGKPTAFKLFEGKADVLISTLSFALGDPTEEALEIARQLSCHGFVIDTENSEQRLGNAEKLAEAFGARYMALEDLERIEDIAIEVERLAGSFPKM